MRWFHPRFNQTFLYLSIFNTSGGVRRLKSHTNALYHCIQNHRETVFIGRSIAWNIFPFFAISVLSVAAPLIKKKIPVATPISARVNPAPQNSAGPRLGGRAAVSRTPVDHCEVCECYNSCFHCKTLVSDCQSCHDCPFIHT